MMRSMAILAGLLLVVPVAMADKYQKTGTVVDVNDKAVVIATDKEGNWEFKRDAGTKLEGDVKTGAKVTVHYSMNASKVEAKADKKK